MRRATIKRKTTETDITVVICLDGRGKGQIDTTIPFLDHMLTLLSRHSLLDLAIKGKGDTEVDDHHLVEDLGICLGDALREALGDKEGINRYGDALVPMDECLCSSAVDFSGRPCLIYNVVFRGKRSGDFDFDLLKEFFKALCDHTGMTLHLNLLYGKNKHHMAEAVFKAFARALRKAVTVDERIRGVLSTKGRL
ncbi:MAG: imidazoleglycerol-phosphate dehydratase HisB [Syntrophales bacterium]|jgi:imidazoleglycerol-phosphate dehydratase